ncbi:gamma-glutamylcyclotransferase family protein, partial [Kushneria aurantia]
MSMAGSETLSVEYYFAYGSNMNPARMCSRVGEVRRALSGRLIDWQLTFDKRSRIDGLAACRACRRQVRRATRPGRFL